MNRWERVRFVVQCAYGCGDIKHPEWVYMRGHFPVCESCAAGMGIRRPAFQQASDEPKEPHGLVPASAPRRGLTAVGAVAGELQDAPTFAAFMTKLRRMVGRS